MGIREIHAELLQPAELYIKVLIDKKTDIITSIIIIHAPLTDTCVFFNVNLYYTWLSKKKQECLPFVLLLPSSMCIAHMFA